MTFLLRAPCSWLKSNFAAGILLVLHVPIFAASMKKTYHHATLIAIAAFSGLYAFAVDEHFPINRFDVVGNHLLSEADVTAAVSSSVGADKAFGDIQHALEALEQAYRSHGFSAVQVSLPEQELISGIVRIDVVESTIDHVIISGNKYFDEANIRSSLPPLQEGQTPNLQKLLHPGAQHRANAKL